MFVFVLVGKMARVPLPLAQPTAPSPTSAAFASASVMGPKTAQKEVARKAEARAKERGRGANVASTELKLQPVPTFLIVLGRLRSSVPWAAPLVAGARVNLFSRMKSTLAEEVTDLACHTASGATRFA